MILHHPVLSVTAGDEFIESYHKAKQGKLGAPYVVLYEGSVADESIAEKFGGPGRNQKLIQIISIYTIYFIIFNRITKRT